MPKNPSKTLIITQEDTSGDAKIHKRWCAAPEDNEMIRKILTMPHSGTVRSTLLLYYPTVAVFISRGQGQKISSGKFT